jgi:hypothetical protein
MLWAWLKGMLPLADPMPRLNQWILGSRTTRRKRFRRTGKFTLFGGTYADAHAVRHYPTGIPNSPESTSQQ